jgi:tetratricopeptide (TPR) repeat protein
LVQARIRVLRADIQATQDGNFGRALEVCEGAAALLEAEGDLEGAAEVWLSAGRLRFWGGHAQAAEQALQRAAAAARRSGNHRAEQESRTWLAATLWDLPIPFDVVVGRTERLLAAASGDPWDEAAILAPLAMAYGYAGRFAEARVSVVKLFGPTDRLQKAKPGPVQVITLTRAANRRAQAIFAASGAKLDRARCIYLAGTIELIAGDPAAAEQILREGYEAVRAMGERVIRSRLVTLLAEAAYAQGRFDQALQLTEEGEALAGAGDVDAPARWRATRAKLLARDGQFDAAARLASEAVALVPGTEPHALRAEFLVAQAEVHRLAGALDQAEASLRQALQVYEDQRMVPLAAQARALLASLTRQAAAH